MCRTPTPKKDRVPCSRCGEIANPNDGWEHGWPLYARLQIGFHSQAGLQLHGETVFPEHPALVNNSAQEIVFEWGNGYKYDSRGWFRMCANCQRELLQTLGRFFRIDHEPYFYAEMDGWVLPHRYYPDTGSFESRDEAIAARDELDLLRRGTPPVPDWAALLGEINNTLHRGLTRTDQLKQIEQHLRRRLGMSHAETNAEAEADTAPA